MIKDEKTTKLSELIGKPLFALNDAVIGGIIKDIGFDKHLNYAKCLIVDTQNPNDLQKKFVHFRDITDSQNDAVVIRYCENIHASWDVYYNKIYCPFQKNVYNQNGRYLGKLTEVVLQKSKVVGIKIDDKDYDYTLIHTISDNAICINDSGKKILSRPKSNMLKSSINKINLPKVKITKKPVAIKTVNYLQDDKINIKTADTSNRYTIAKSVAKDVVTRSNTNNQDTYSDNRLSEEQKYNEYQFEIEKTDNVKISTYEDTPPKNNTNYVQTNETQTLNIEDMPTMPIRIDSTHTEVTKTPKDNQSYDKYYFIKNKILTNDIFDSYGNKIFKKGTLITDEVIDVAKINNRLVHLVLYSN